MIYNRILHDPPVDPGAVALVEGDRHFSRRDLDHAARALEARMRESGIGETDTFAVGLPNCAEMVVALLAGLRLRARILFLSPEATHYEQRLFCRRAGTERLAVGGGGQCAPGLRPIEIPALETLLSEHPADRFEPMPEQTQDAVFLFLSSGSTGESKIVVNEADAFANILTLFKQPWPTFPDDRVGVVLPLYHIFGMRMALAGTLAAGGSAYLLPMHPRKLAPEIERKRITVLPTTPFHLRMLVETRFSSEPDLSSLRVVFCGGSLLPEGLAVAFRERFGVRIVQTYGTTEAGSGMYAEAEHMVPGRGWPWRPWPSVTVTIRGEDGVELPPEEPGLLAIASTGCTRSYLDDPEADAQTYRDGYVLTGDTAVRDEEGNIFLLGRSRPMINISGAKVAPAEVEGCLRLHPAVLEARVVADITPTGDQRVKAIVATGETVSADELRAFCAERLEPIKVPQLIEFGEVEASGPLDKLKLVAKRADV